MVEFQLARGVDEARNYFVFCFEIKTATSVASRQNLLRRVNQYGPYQSCFVSSTAEFKLLVPDSAHRVQCLHHMATIGITTCFLVYEVPGSIQQVIALMCNAIHKLRYVSALQQFAMEHMGWVSQGTTERNIYNLVGYLPDLDDYGYAVDKQTIATNLQLWDKASRMIQRHGAPLPTAKAIVPSMVAFWNTVKGGVDVYSRFLKNIKVSNARLSPTEYINLRMVNTLILNAFHCTQLLSSEQYLKNCKSYRLWKKKLNHVSGGFREFLGRVATRISRSDFEIGPCDSDEETRTREAVNEWTKIGTPLVPRWPAGSSTNL